MAVVNWGVADGYLGCCAGLGAMSAGGRHLPVVGRISMDLTVVDVSGLPDISEEDWLEVDYKLVDAAAASGVSQYELLTGLGARFDRDRKSTRLNSSH